MKTKEDEFENLEKRINTERTKTKIYENKGKVGQCKILLSKKSSFPFHMKNKSNVRKEKNNQSKLFLDSSNISEISITENEEMFITPDSLH